MQDLATAAKQTAELLKTLTADGGLRLKYRIVAGAGAADPDGLEDRLIYVDIGGPDAHLLTDRDGEMLRALEHIAARTLRLEPDEHDRVSFDSDNFKADRAAGLRETAERGVSYVRDREKPYSFEPMSSRERRLLHLILKAHDDLRTESSGEGPRRFVVLYPKNMPSRPESSRSGPRSDSRSGTRPDSRNRADEIAKRFRRR